MRVRRLRDTSAPRSRPRDRSRARAKRLAQKTSGVANRRVARPRPRVAEEARRRFAFSRARPPRCSIATVGARRPFAISSDPSEPNAHSRRAARTGRQKHLAASARSDPKCDSVGPSQARSASLFSSPGESVDNLWRRRTAPAGELLRSSSPRAALFPRPGRWSSFGSLANHLKSTAYALAGGSCTRAFDRLFRPLSRALGCFEASNALEGPGGMFA